MDYTARYGLEFNPFLKNSKDVFVNTQEQQETLYLRSMIFTVTLPWYWGLSPHSVSPITSA